MTSDTPDFKVADLSLGAFGRAEIKLAEHEMPGLMAMRAEFGSSRPLTGSRIAGSFAHDDPDRGPRRDPRRAGRRRSLGQLQYLFHPRPRRGRRGRWTQRNGRESPGRAGLRVEG